MEKYYPFLEAFSGGRDGDIEKMLLYCRNSDIFKPENFKLLVLCAAQSGNIPKELASKVDPPLFAKD